MAEEGEKPGGSVLGGREQMRRSLATGSRWSTGIYPPSSSNATETTGREHQPSACSFENRRTLSRSEISAWHKEAKGNVFTDRPRPRRLSTGVRSEWPFPEKPGLAGT